MGLTLALTGCGSDDDPAPGPSGSGSTTSSAYPAPTTETDPDPVESSTTSTPTTPTTTPTTTTTTTVPVEPVLAIEDLTGRDTTVALDSGFVSALTSLGLAPAAIGTARIDQGAIVFPVTDGSLEIYEPGAGGGAGDYRGPIRHDGSGLSLSAGGTEVALTGLVVDLRAARVLGTVAVDGNVVADDADLFDLDLATLQTPTVDDRAVVLEGARVLVSATLARVLNDTFATDALSSALLVGVARITVAVP